MSLGQTLITANPSTTIRSADYNANLNALNGASIFTVSQPPLLLAGNQETGFCGFEGGNIVVSEFSGAIINFKTVMQNVPTSLTLTLKSSSNFPTPAAANFTIYGCSISAAASATAGQGWWFGTYTTVGNCLWAVDAKRGIFDHHCQGCDGVRTGLKIAREAVVETHYGDAPMLSRLSVLCPVCGTRESFDTNISVAAEQGWDLQGLAVTDPRRQAHLIRALQRVVGLALRD